MAQGYKTFLSWIKSELIAGHHVTIGLTDQKDFSYSHIVSIFLERWSLASFCILYACMHPSFILVPWEKDNGGCKNGICFDIYITALADALGERCPCGHWQCYSWIFGHRCHVCRWSRRNFSDWQFLASCAPWIRIQQSMHPFHSWVHIWHLARPHLQDRKYPELHCLYSRWLRQQLWIFYNWDSR